MDISLIGGDRSEFRSINNSTRSASAVFNGVFVCASPFIPPEQTRQITSNFFLDASAIYVPRKLNHGVAFRLNGLVCVQACVFAVHQTDGSICTQVNTLLGQLSHAPYSCKVLIAWTFGEKSKNE